LRSLQRFLGTDPGNTHLFNECAALAQQLQDYEALLHVAETRLQAHPGDLPAASARTKALIGRGDFQSAALDLERMSTSAPQVPAFQQDLGLCYYCLGEFARARAPLEGALRLGERSAGLLRLLASTYHHLGLMAEAAALATENPTPAQGDGDLAAVYALIYLDAGRADEAARWTRQALALNPHNVDALTVEGTLATASGALDTANECFQRVLQRAPDTGRAWIGLGSTALLRRDLPDALEKLRRAVELMPTHVGSWHVLGWTYLLSGDLDGAEGAFQRTLELNRNFAESHGSLAAIAALRGDRATAERNMEVAQRLDPMCLSAQFTRSVLAGRAGDEEKARRIVLKALSRLAVDPGMAMVAGLTTKGAVTRH
jgi:Flp pilus assembly protein TadD